MIGVAGTAAAVLLLATVWMSMLRTVFIPHDDPPRMAQWTPRIVMVCGVAACRLLPRRMHEPVLRLCAPVSLFVMFAAWLLGVGTGFVVLALTVGGLPPDPVSVDRFLVLETPGSAADALGLADLVAVLLVAVVFTVHLVRVTDAHDARERLVSRLAAEATRLTDAEKLVVSHVRADLSGRSLDRLFADWVVWLADVRFTHLGYPVLMYFRPAATRLCWLKAAVIVLDAAALVRAIAPGWAPARTGAVLDAGAGCLRRLASGMGISLPPIPVSLHGREEFGFADTVRLVASSGLPAESDVARAWRSFQASRTGYAPYAVSIASRLSYLMDPIGKLASLDLVALRTAGEIDHGVPTPALSGVDPGTSA